MGVRENKVEMYLKSRVEKLGGTSRKWISPGVDGVPDQIIIFPERTVFAEVKTADGTLETYQAREHVRLREAGATVTTIYGASGVDNFIADLVENSLIKSEYR